MGVVRRLLSGRFTWWSWVGALAAPVVVLVGTWLAGGVLTEDMTMAMRLTGVWFATVTGAALWLVWARARPALPVLGAVLLTVGAVGGWLMLASSVDRVADETVLRPAQAAPAGGPAATALAQGDFRSDAHETVGAAALLRRADGGTVLTLTEFATDPGPDLRVMLVPAGADGAAGAVDLGALKGNKGDQQYDVPAGAPTGRVLVWCRAFSVSFGSADLRPV